MNSKEVWLLGPPGTGKTTKLTAYILEGVQKVGNNGVLVGSFTKAAATELISRQLPVPESNIGTLHALCYRALGRPEIAEVKHIAEWNTFEPQYALSKASGKVNVDNPTSEEETATDGDRLLQEYNTLRAKLTPREYYNPDVEAFALRWDFWKDLNGFVDFTGLIERGITHLDFVPGKPRIMYMDECQDFSALELKLVRKWEQSVDLCFMSFDDDQSIYHFKGASPEELIRNPAAKQQVLKQSYRVPRAILDKSQEWIKQVNVRAVKEYKPRWNIPDDPDSGEAIGSIRYLDASYKYIEPVIDDALEQVASGKKVMILATCSYMLDPLKAVLRREGIPFCNPYRTTRGDWNPLRFDENRISAAQRLSSYLKVHEGQLWTPNDITLWSEDIRAAGIFIHGGKTALSEGEWNEDPAVAAQQMAFQFEEGVYEEAFANAYEGETTWFEKNLLASRINAYTYPVTVYKKGGIQNLLTRPSIIIGTIHSVKGGEADIVYLFPDLSLAGINEWNGNGGSEGGKDAIVRLFYVAMTRAKEELVLCNASQQYYIQL